MFRQAKPWLLFGQVILDIGLINLAFLIAYLGRYEFEWIRPVDEFNFVSYREYLPVSLILTVILVIVYRIEGLYHQRRGATWLDDLYTITIGTAVGMAVIIVLFYGLRPNFYSRLLFAYVSIAIAIVLGLSRLMIRQVRGRLRARGMGIDRVLIVGAGELGRAAMRGIIALPQLGYRVVGFLDDRPERRSVPIGRFPALGETRDLPRVLEQHPVEEVIITLPWTDHQRILELVQHCEQKGVRVRIVPDLFQMSLTSVDVDDLGGIPLIGLRVPSLRGANILVKRIFDLAIGVPLTLLALPLA
ncbi:MAG: sugar transferase, partial [Chloroflexi bacterium]|nr:sugar transferase [Chloroflexota bacterium]